MKLAVIGRATPSGLGTELIDAVKHLPVSVVGILDGSLPLKVGVPMVRLSSSAGSMEAFLNVHKPDAVLTWEDAGSWQFPAVWRRRGIRWWLVVHWDWFPADHMAEMAWANLISPNQFCLDNLRAVHGLKSTPLRVPVDTGVFRFKERAQAVRFVTVWRNGGERRSLSEILAAWRMMKDPPVLDVMAHYPPEQALIGMTPPGVHWKVACPDNPEALYENADVAVQVSRYEGVGLTILEAQACGLPVITVDREPMASLASCKKLLVSVERVDRVSNTRNHIIDAHVPSALSIKTIVDYVRKADIRPLSHQGGAFIEYGHSWAIWRKWWMAALFKQ